MFSTLVKLDVEDLTDGLLEHYSFARFGKGKESVYSIKEKKEEGRE
jgi:hypothetical protein